MKSVSVDAVTSYAKKMRDSFRLRTAGTNTCIAACLSILSTLLLPSLLYDSSIGFSNSLFSVAYAFVLYLLFKWYYGREHCKRKIILTHVFGFMLSCMTAMGRAFDQTGRFFPVSLAVCASIVLYIHVFACGVSFVWQKLSDFEAAECNKSKGAIPTETSERRFPTLFRRIEYVMTHRWLTALLLLLCWLPCFIALFPGGFSYDVTAEFNQQFEIYLRPFPRLHSVLLIGCLNASHGLFGSYNAGIACYAIVQMILFSLLFADMLAVLWDKRLHMILFLFLAGYCAFFPVIHLTVTHIGRDTLFAGLLTYLAFLLFRMSTEREKFFASLRGPALLGFVLSMTLLSRNNTSEVLTLLLLAGLNAVVWFRLRHKFSREIKVFAAVNMSVYLSLSVILSLVCQPISTPNPLSSMGIVSQTLVRANIDEPDKWTPEDSEAYNRYFFTDRLEYCPELADLTRNCISKEAFRADYIGFIKLWVKMGCKCPTSYANAFLAQNRYMWYPDSLIDGYVRSGTYDSEKCYFVTGVASPGTRIHFWPALEEYYRTISADISFEKIPIFSMLFSVGFQFWLLLNCFFYAVYRSKRRLYLPIGLILLYTVICLFLPIVIMRYFMVLFLFFPITIVATFPPKERF